MKRRGITVAVGAILVVVLFRLMAIAPVPYAEFVPGPTYDVLGKDTTGKDVIEVKGATVTQSKGQLRFLTVGAIPDLTLAQALVGWWRDDSAVIPREFVIPVGRTVDQENQRNAEEFATSQSEASTAAEIALGYPEIVSVKDVLKDKPAAGKLQVGDVINTVDGQKVDCNDRLLKLIQSKPVGTTLSFGITRAGAAMTVAITTVAGDQGQPQVGISTDAKPTAPFSFTVPIENIGGPSAGLMLTLGMIDKIEPTDLTGGKIIAGTGTIDGTGTVGEIGGIPEKIIAAKDGGAQYFLTPVDNCAEAVANQVPGMPLIKVANLSQAMDALAKIRAGTLPELCPGAH